MNQMNNQMPMNNQMSMNNQMNNPMNYQMNNPLINLIMKNQFMNQMVYKMVTQIYTNMMKNQFMNQTNNNTKNINNCVDNNINNNIKNLNNCVDNNININKMKDNCCNHLKTSINSKDNEVKKTNDLIKNRNSITEEDFKELKEVFEMFDKDKKGKINPKDLKESLKALDSVNIEENIYKNLDIFIQKNENITFEQFVNLIYCEKDYKSKEELRNLFNSLVDDKNSDVITFNSLKKAIQEIGENTSDQEIKDLIKNSSKNGRDVMTFEEFYEIMSKV
jgi:Ca2+-binding EF-hand superfamily protein